MNSFHLNTYSHTRHNITIVIGALVGASCMGIAAMNKLSFGISIGMMIAIVIIAKLVAIKFYKANAIFAVSDSGLNITWIKNFPIRPEPNYNFDFKNLEQYVFEPWGETYKLKLTTKQGKVVKFLFKQSKNDEISYTAFFDKLQNAINAYNDTTQGVMNDLQIGRTFWQSKVAQILAVILAGGLIWLWAKVLSGELPNINLIKLIITSLFALGLILRIVIAVLPINRETE